MTRLMFGFLVLVFFSGNLPGQVRYSNSEKFSYVLADMEYSSDAVFMGRRDSVKAPYLLPSIGYYDKSGFFADASASYLTKSGEERIDLFLLSAGYIFSKSNFSAGLSGTKYFFNNESYNVQSEIEAAINGIVSYNFNAAEVTLRVSGYFGTSSPDLFTSLILDHTFYGIEKRLLISPAIAFSAGSQNFYEEYYNTSRLGNRKGGGNNQQGPGVVKGGPMLSQDLSGSVQIREASEFNLLNIEARLPIQFYYKDLIFSFTPAIAFPQTSSTITTTDTIFKEDLNSVFYWTAGISFWLKTSK